MSPKFRSSHKQHLLKQRQLLKSKQKQSWPGWLVCRRTLPDKLHRLRELGILDSELLDELRTVIDIRNEQAHGYSLTVGYKVTPAGDFGEARTSLRPFPITLTYNVYRTRTDMTPEYLRWLGDELVMRASERIDALPSFSSALVAIDEYVERLPVDPQPQLSQLTATRDMQERMGILDDLNQEYIGVQWSRLLKEIELSKS